MFLHYPYRSASAAMQFCEYQSNENLWSGINGGYTDKNAKSYWRQKS